MKLFSNLVKCGAMWASFLCLWGAQVSYAAALDSIVAVVNDSVITQAHLDQNMKLAKEQLVAEHAALPSPAVLRERVLQRMIDVQLQLQVAKRLNLSVNDEQLDRAIANIAAEHQMSVAQLRETLAKQGTPYSKYREEIRDEMTIAQLAQKEVGSKIVISDAAIQKLAKTLKLKPENTSEYHLYSIVIPLPKTPTPADIKRANEQANTLLQAWRTNTNVQQVISQVPAVPGQLPIQQGDLGWHALSEFPEAFSSRIQGLRIGDVVGPIQTPNGVIHVMKLLEVRAAPQPAAMATQTHVRHILIKTDTLNNTAAVKVRLAHLKTKLEHGENFAELAGVNSQDPGSATQGGDLGWTTPGSLVPEFQAAIDKLKVQQISQPFMTPYGWHIAQVLGRRQFDISKNRAQEEARSRLYHEQFSTALKEWLKTLRQQAYIDIFSKDRAASSNTVN